MGLEVEEDLPSLRFEVLDIMSLVKDHVIPLLPSEDGMVSYCNFVAGDADVETVQFGPPFSLLLALLSGPEVGHDLEGWAPPLELDLPVHQDGRRHDD